MRIYLEEQNFISNNVLTNSTKDKVRNLALFLILNGDYEVLRQMADIDEIESLLWMLPTIPKYLMCEIFWSLHFDEFVYESIAFCNPQLSLELASAFLDNIKYYSPMESLHKLKIIAEATYRAICRLHFYKFDSKTLSDKVSKNFSNLEKCMIYFCDPPKAEKLDNLSKDNLYKYKGDCLYTVLELVDNCLELFSGTHELYPENVGELYTYTHLKGTLLNEFNFNPCESPNMLITECFNRVHTVLLDKFQYLVMDVSVDIFCAWSEFMENGRSMQQKIGECCYKVHKKLLSVNSVAGHPVVDMLQQISSKPVDVNELVNASDTTTIIEKINNNSGEDKVAWLQALIYKDDLCQNRTLIEYLSANIHLLNEEQSIKLFKVVKNYLSSIPENKYNLEILAVNAFQHCSNDAKYELLNEHFSDNVFEDMTETEEFRILLTETFNKIISSSESDVCRILTLFLQNPKKVYTKMFDLALENTHQTNIIVDAIKLIENFSNHYYSSDMGPCLIVVMQKSFENLDTDKKKNNFVYLISELESENCITSAKLLMLIVMPNLHKALLNRDLGSLYVLVKILKEAYILPELLQYRAPVLAMLAQVLDVTRWKIDSFADYGPETLHLALQLQTSLINTYRTTIPDKESNWLKAKVKNLHSLNMYYYRKLWDLPGNNFAEIISGKHINSNMDTEQLATWISQIICSSTQDEWCDLWDSFAVFPNTIILNIFHDAMSLLTIAEGANRTEGSWPCLLYCYTNFVYAIRYKFFKEPLRDNQVNPVVDKISVTANLIEEDNIEELATAFLPLFAYMAERRNDYKMNISHYLRNKLRHKKFADTIKQVFENANGEN
ncbi:uncharacterized protein LOC128670008 isoform X2 [Plodia interpunctella]|nr:uncharacterized protein LOC128670008 isoform X2 [Plodia interpunctella]